MKYWIPTFNNYQFPKCYYTNKLFDKMLNSINSFYITRNKIMKSNIYIEDKLLLCKLLYNIVEHRILINTIHQQSWATKWRSNPCDGFYDHLLFFKFMIPEIIYTYNRWDLVHAIRNIEYCDNDIFNSIVKDTISKNDNYLTDINNQNNYHNYK